MSIKRRSLGVVLVAIAAVMFVAVLVAGLLRGDWHYEGGGSDGVVYWASYRVDSGVSGYYFIPIFLCGAIGAFCLFWPGRRPPKLNQ